MSENGEIYSAGKNFTLPPALTAWTNSTSALTQQNLFLLSYIFLLLNIREMHALGCGVVVSKSYNISGGGKSFESCGCRCMEHMKSSQRDRKITPQPGNEPPRSFDRTGGKRNFRWRSFFAALAASLYETTFENMSRQYLKENFLPVCGKH